MIKDIYGANRYIYGKIIKTVFCIVKSNKICKEGYEDSKWVWNTASARTTK